MILGDPAILIQEMFRITPHLHLRPGIRQILEPMHVQALLPHASVERLNVGIIGRLARPREVQRDFIGIGPWGENKECLNREGRGVGPCPSSVQQDHVGT